MLANKFNFRKLILSTAKDAKESDNDEYTVSRINNNIVSIQT